MNDTVTQNNNKIKYTMCGRKGSCCPVLSEVEDNKFTITDDFNGSVILTKDELLLLNNFLNSNDFKKHKVS